eukprot:9807394-Heterocapsa_arctica.AAC.1
MGQVLGEQGKPWIVETPKRRAGNASVFKLPEIIELMSVVGVSVAAVDQCMTGAATTKPTELLLNK